MDRRREGVDSDDDDVPLHHKRPFGSGLKRKRVEFVRAQQPDNSMAALQQESVPAGDLYASIVLSRQDVPRSIISADDTGTDDAPKMTACLPDNPEENESQPSAPLTCPICSLPITTTASQHEASLAHQVSLAHSHPPSSVDRNRMGLRALSSQGWDPDARLGLGSRGDGVRFPIKVAPKEDTLGVGAKMPEARGEGGEARKVKKLSAKEMRAEIEREKRRGERLQREIFSSVDVEKYLRG